MIKQNKYITFCFCYTVITLGMEHDGGSMFLSSGMECFASVIVGIVIG